MANPDSKLTHCPCQHQTLHLADDIYLRLMHTLIETSLNQAGTSKSRVYGHGRKNFMARFPYMPGSVLTMRHQSRILVIQWLALHAQISIMTRLRVKVLMLDQSLKLDLRRRKQSEKKGDPNSVTWGVMLCHTSSPQCTLLTSFWAQGNCMVWTQFSRPAMLSYADVCEECINDNSMFQWVVLRDFVR